MLVQKINFGFYPADEAKLEKLYYNNYMTSNPFYNAGLALIYIVFVVTVMQTGSHFARQTSGDDFWLPVGMLSLFVLSAAIMACVFLYQPIVMFLDGKRREAISLFWCTVAVFAGVTFIILITAAFVIK